ncbi:pentapeptide repeat-containing protein [Allocoleopsis franciscana]|uniref:Putative low-complexity protein n=1 Tax=Allocoleopsis franciscana PCC 7113 TaxID=1173027 RepID=K9WFY5_9CYAN|nr:pentapeptide repeat-containing protein [Allocoleopsis franciscana]AFZ18679.1 putative low-complexity protein [Allocoleopsis franciscana PCC 7113]
MTNQPNPPQSSPQTDHPNGSSDYGTVLNPVPLDPSLAEVTLPQEPSPLSILPLSGRSNQPSVTQNMTPSLLPLITFMAIAILILGLSINNFWIGMSGAIVTLLLSIPVIWPPVKRSLIQTLSPEERSQFVAVFGLIAAIIGLASLTGVTKRFDQVLRSIDSDSIGSLAEWIGALGQIMIAVLAVYIAWRQYVISKDLTIQQNVITQQQTIDAYFQGVCDLALDDEGLLEDWPQERAFSEGRTAAILGSVDPLGKAKVLRFLSQSRLLTPLKRDTHLGRPILDGNGGYQEDRERGVRVIDLNIMLAGADLSGTDLRWTELSEANMVRANLSGCDLVKANLSRTILYEANLSGADLKGVRLFYGSLETASPRSRSKPPDYNTGAHTGAVVENANFTDVQRLDEEQRKYCCYWCGERSRRTIPGGCDGLPNKLGR